MTAILIAAALSGPTGVGGATATPAMVEAPAAVELSVAKDSGRWLPLPMRLSSITLDLVRANVIVTRSRGERPRILVEAVSRTDPADAALLRVEQGGTTVRLVDIYPSAKSNVFGRECLPSLEGHGDVWESSTRLTIRLVLPNAATVQGQVRDGAVSDTAG